MWCDGGVRALMPPATWESLISRGLPFVFPRGNVLVSEGHLGTHVFILVEGHVKVTRHEADGTEVLLAIRAPGEIIGEMSVLDDSVASATVTALRTCTAHRLSARDFKELVRIHDLAEPMLRLSSARRRESDQIRIELSVLSVPRRLIRTLLRLMDTIGVETDDGVKVDFGVAQEELAHAIGASRTQVAAALAQLRTEGILVTGRCRVVIRDPEGLREHDC